MKRKMGEDEIKQIALDAYMRPSPSCIARAITLSSSISSQPTSLLMDDRIAVLSSSSSVPLRRVGMVIVCEALRQLSA